MLMFLPHLSAGSHQHKPVLLSPEWWSIVILKQTSLPDFEIKIWAWLQMAPDQLLTVK